jgi:ABC-type uncharacterized transport system auxiliary subunit
MKMPLLGGAVVRIAVRSLAAAAFRIVGRSLAAAAILLAGCSVVKTPERPEWTTFVLDAPPASPIETLSSSDSSALASDGGHAEKQQPVLRVAPITSGAGYDTPRMAYLRSEGTIEYFSRHRWAEPPSTMIEPLLVAALEGTGRFASIVDPSSRAVGDASLESELLVFRLEVNGSAARFHATLRANLVGASDRRPLAPARTFDVVEPADKADAPAGAAAARSAVSRLAADVAAWCAGITIPR